MARAVWFSTVPLNSGQTITSPWVPHASAYQMGVQWVASGGTTTVTVEGSFDGVSVDADFTYSNPTSGTPFKITSPYVRVKVAQTVANATKTKVYAWVQDV